MKVERKMMYQEKRQTGFTLTEVLVAIVLTLILLLLMIRVFAITGSEIAKGRAVLEMAGQLRSTAELLRQDLNGLTARMLTRNQYGSATGYFEYIEGKRWDGHVYTYKNAPDPAPPSFFDYSMVYGDIDDILMFTTRSLDQPFRGRWNGQIIESNHAEVIWWTVFEDEDENGQFDVGEDLKLYRRVLLIRPDLVTSATDLGEFLQFNDVSVRQPAGSNRIVANTLSDLTDRANRFARAGTTFPHEPNFALLQGSSAFVLTHPTGLGSANLNAGEDVMLSGISAFDVKVFDPSVRVLESPDSTVGLLPSDIGYAAGVTTNPQFGGYVDLNTDANLGVTSGGLFTRGPEFPAPDNPSLSWTHATYCTWSLHYESDGMDQDNDEIIDEGTNATDQNNLDGPDDVNEFETRPPYPYPLRGLQVTIRLVEPTNQVLRQTSVITNFVPE